MRLFPIVALIALAGCATRSPGPNSIEWYPVAAHPGGAPAPAVENGSLILFGSAVRSSGTYAAPVTIECEIQPQPASSNSTFYIGLVPEGQPTSTLPADYVGIKLVYERELSAWLSQSNQLTTLIKPTLVRANANGSYRFSIAVHGDGIVVQANNETARIDKVLPFEKFHIELRTFPPPNSWRVQNFSVR